MHAESTCCMADRVMLEAGPFGIRGRPRPTHPIYATGGVAQALLMHTHAPACSSQPDWAVGRLLGLEQRLQVHLRHRRDLLLRPGLKLSFVHPLETKHTPTACGTKLSVAPAECGSSSNKTPHGSGVGVSGRPRGTDCTCSFMSIGAAALAGDPPVLGRRTRAAIDGESVWRAGESSGDRAALPATDNTGRSAASSWGLARHVSELCQPCVCVRVCVWVWVCVCDCVCVYVCVCVMCVCVMCVCVRVCEVCV